MEDILAKLVAFHSTTENRSANNVALDFIDRFISDRGMHVKQLEFDGYRSLVATTNPHSKTPTVMLAGHIDIVPGPDEAFMLQKDADKFYGRGVLDMKGPLAVFLKVIDDIKADITKFDIGLMISSDEETGGFHGIPNLLDKGYLPKVCILPDGGDNWQIQLSAKGVLQFKVITSGQAAHGSQPWNGDNANLKLIRLIHDIQQLFPENGPDNNTINIGKISGGDAINQVPDSAEALIDIRVLSEKDKTRLRKEIESICKSHAAKLDLVVDSVGASADLHDPYIKRFAEIVTEVTGVPITGSHAHGSSDARFFTTLGIPCISLYPPGGGHHGAHEWVGIEGLHQLEEIVTQYVIETAAESSKVQVQKPDLFA